MGGDPVVDMIPAEPVRRFDVEAPLEIGGDAVAQWLDWEAQANLVGFRTSTAPVEVEVVSVPRQQTEIHVLSRAPQALVDRFLRGDRVLFPRHPLNRDPSAAWFDATPSERWSSRFTSSRTLAMPGPESGAAQASSRNGRGLPAP